MGLSLALRTADHELEPVSIQPEPAGTPSSTPLGASLETAPPEQGQPLPGNGVGRDPAAAGAAPQPVDPRRFAGTGEVRGTVVLSEGVRLPATWQIVAEPSRWLPGKEFAVRSALDVSAELADFALTGLPFGGYSVSIRAAGLNCRPVDVQIDSASPSPYVTLEVSPAGSIHGSVLNEAGGFVEGLDVWIEERPGKERTRALTGTDGAFTFENVIDGEYRLTYGNPDNPVLPPRTLSFQAPSMHLDPVTVPDFSVLAFRVTDEVGTGLQGVHVRGAGTGGGYVSVRTDESGLAEASFLPAGRYRISAEEKDVGRVFEIVELGKGERRDVELVLRP